MPSAMVTAEASALSRYLVNRDCPTEMVERYDRGRALLAGPGAGRDAVTAFAIDRPWSLPFLDAGAAFVHGGETLRARVLLMAAILEASTRFADEFSARDTGRGRLLVETAGHTLRAGFHLLVGVPLLLLLRCRE